MRRTVIVTLMIASLVAAGCGFKPPSAPPTKADTCTDPDGPTPETVQQAIAALPNLGPGASWSEEARGHATNCRLHWVQLTSSFPSASRPEQVLFFDHNTSLGAPTPEPKPYITVISGGDDYVTVQYQWQVGNEPACCPTGIGTVRFTIGDDGKLKALDPIPNR
jgi:hypothetical protein